MTMASYRRVAGLAALLVVPGLLGACSSAHSSAAQPGTSAGGTASRGGTAGASPSASNGESTQLGNEALYFSVPATGAQQTIGAQFFGLRNALESIGTAKCMQQHGFQSKTMSASAWAAQFIEPTDFPDLARIKQVGLGAPGIPGPPPGSSTMSSSEQAAYNADADRCSNASSQLFKAVDNASSALQALWMPTVTSAESSPTVEATLPAFWQCAQQEGVPAQPDPQHPLVPGAPSSSYFGAFLGYVDGVVSRTTSEAAYGTVLKHWGLLFVHCATPVVAQLDKILLPAQQTFLQDHFQQVQGLEQLANQTVAKAEQEYGTPTAN